MEGVVDPFGVEGAGSTVLHPVGLVMLLLCGGLFVGLPRRYALWAFLVLICFVSSRQAIAIAGFNLYFPRFMVLVFGLFGRGILRGELGSVRLNRLDWLVLSYGLLYFACGAVNWDFLPSEMKTRSGYVSEIIGTYFVFRMLIHDREDAVEVIRGLAIVSLPLLGFFLFEHQTGRNLFSVFGGVPEITAVRDGRLRSQGAFGHPILAGVFWAAMLPLIIAGALEISRSKVVFKAGVVASLGIVGLTASSTPVLGVAAGLGGWACFRLRRYSKQVFPALGVLIVVLHLVMKAPVWSLIQRINVTSGNSGYHRYILVDGFITHMSEWWLIGSRLGTDHWGHFTFDTANQFVAVGVAAGTITLLVFFAIIWVAMSATGRIEAISPHLAWGVGVSVFVLAVCFFGISIWGQLHFAWSLPIAIAGSLGFARERCGLPAPRPARRAPLQARTRRTTVSMCGWSPQE